MSGRKGRGKRISNPIRATKLFWTVFGAFLAGSVVTGIVGRYGVPTPCNVLAVEAAELGKEYAIRKMDNAIAKGMLSALPPSTFVRLAKSEFRKSGVTQRQCFGRLMAHLRGERSVVFGQAAKPAASAYRTNPEAEKSLRRRKLVR